MSSPSQHPLIAFFEGSEPDPHGRYLQQILRWSDQKLENSHDYIQTLFPLPEHSGVNWDAEVIDKEVFEAFRSRQDLQVALRAAFKRILNFYGFKTIEHDGELQCRKLSNFNEAARNWVHRYDHNHLRITRIIRSLRVLGLDREAQAFYNAVKDIQVQSTISDRSLRYWTRAMERPLNIRPDEDEEHETMGPRFLREFVSNQKQLRDKSSDNVDIECTKEEDHSANIDSHPDDDRFEEGDEVPTNIEGPSGNDRHEEKDVPSNVTNATDNDKQKEVGDTITSAENTTRNPQNPFPPLPQKGDTKSATEEAEEIAPPLIHEELSPFREEALPRIENEDQKTEEAEIIARKEAMNNGEVERDEDPKPLAA